MAHPDTAFDLKGKVIVITGATQGQGADIAELCAQAGALGVVLAGRNPDRGEKVRATLATAFPQTKFVFVVTDVSKEEDCRLLISRTEQEFSRVDGLVNCAAYNPRAYLDETTAPMFDLIYQTNLRGPFILTQEFVRVVRKHGVKGSSIVNIASVQANGGAPFSMAYATSKAALVALTKNNAQELRKDRIRVNCVNMGWTLTDNEDQLQKDWGDVGEKWADVADAAHPFGRLLRPRDVSKVVVFLLSDLSAMMTGSIVPIHPEVIDGCLPAGVGGK
eukprot:TRINITY_DN3338_c0_g1_i1.p1 TRINITY_DN3338_c0_g1~~TRINITY_DN3338_c0_g1_i1.p1  ORF type:complete len:283 (-),score=46.75 TRINITY_DN3338_c0_g1_i1:129-956(-)